MLLSVQLLPIRFLLLGFLSLLEGVPEWYLLGLLLRTRLHQFAFVILILSQDQVLFGASGRVSILFAFVFFVASSDDIDNLLGGTALKWGARLLDCTGTLTPVGLQRRETSRSLRVLAGGEHGVLRRQNLLQGRSCLRQNIRWTLRAASGYGPLLELPLPLLYVWPISEGLLDRVPRIKFLLRVLRCHCFLWGESLQIRRWHLDVLGVSERHFVEHFLLC